MKRLRQTLQAIVQFYVDGFRSMKLGRTLWLIIGIKLLVMFLVLRLFFFRPYYEGLSKAETSDRVATVLGGQ